MIDSDAALRRHALAADKIILHTMGGHGGEPPHIFIPNKLETLRLAPVMYWYGRSLAPPDVQQFGRENELCGQPTYVWFYDRRPDLFDRRKQHAGTPTKVDHNFGYMTHICSGDRDSGRFEEVDYHIHRITGRVDRRACGLVFDWLDVVRPGASINMAEWSDKPYHNPNVTAWVAARKHPHGEMRKYYIVAVGRLAKPYGVWFRGMKSLHASTALPTQTRTGVDDRRVDTELSTDTESQLRERNVVVAGRKRENLMKTIRTGIARALGRDEQGLNLPFSSKQVITLSDVLGLNPEHHTYVDLRNAVAGELGFEPWITNRERLSINERLKSKHYRKDNLQFRIEHVEKMCMDLGIIPDERERKDLSEAIYVEVLKRQKN